MTQWMVRIFPACAILISVLAYFLPGAFTPFGKLIVPLLGLIMLGMGTTLAPEDFLAAAKRPKAVLTGMTLQFLLMPLLAFAIGRALRLDREAFIGLVMVGTVAGGTASNVITYLAGGDVALSITMTACSTLAGIVLTPLLSSFYLGTTVKVPAWAMFQSILLVVAVPVALGVAIRRICRGRTAWLEKICPVVSSTGIVLVIGIIFALNAPQLRTSGLTVALAVILHNLAGLAAGYGCARLCRCDQRTALTIAIEVGMQNSGLAAALSKQFFTVGAALPGAIFSIWHNLSGALFAAWMRHRIAKPRRNSR